MSDNEERKTVLNPDEWDEDMVEAAQAVYDGLVAANQIYRRMLSRSEMERPAWDRVLEIYDRLQEQLRTPVLASQLSEKEIREIVFSADPELREGIE